MGLSPNDVRSYEFSQKMRGYDKEEVDNFLEQAAQALEAVKQENINLSMELDTLRAQVANLKQNEDVIKSAAIDARRNADLTIANAKKEALVIIEKAKEEGERVVAERIKKIHEIEQQIKRAEQNRKNYLGKLRTLVSSHLDLVERESEAEVREELSSESVPSAEAPSPSPNDITVTESEDVTSENRETIAEVPEDERSEVEEELRSTVQEEETQDSAVHEISEVADKVEEGDTELADALRKFDQVKEAHPPYLRDKDEDKDIPEPIPSLASPSKKWVETTARAEEPPPEFIAKKAGEEAPAPPPSPAPDTAPPEGFTPTSSPPAQEANQSGGMEPNPISSDDTSDTDHKMQAQEPAQRSGKVDVEKEFDEIAAKFNEEMDRAENKDA